VFTAAITAAIAAILSLFGIKPGPYLVVVAIVVKVIIVCLGLFFGIKLSRKRKAEPPPPSEAAPPPSEAAP
jgi:hypothetical protein